MLIKNETCDSHERQVSTNVLYVNNLSKDDRVFRLIFSNISQFSITDEFNHYLIVTLDFSESDT